MEKLKQIFIVEIPSFIVSGGLGLISGYWGGFYRGGMFSVTVFLILQPFVLFFFFRGLRSAANERKRSL